MEGSQDIIQFLPKDIQIAIWKQILCTPQTFTNLRRVSKHANEFVCLYSDLTLIGKDLLKFLIKKGYLGLLRLIFRNPSIHSNASTNLVSQACIADQPDTLRFLLFEALIDPPPTSLIVSISNANPSIVQLLLQHPKIDPALEQNRAINDASARGLLDIVRLLLADPRVDPSAQRNAAIIRASGNGLTEVVQLLLSDPRVDPAARTGEALIMACTKGYTDTVKVLLQDTRVMPSVQNNLPYKRAKEGGHVEILNVLSNNPRFVQ